MTKPGEVVRTDSGRVVADVFDVERYISSRTPMLAKADRHLAPGRTMKLNTYLNYGGNCRQAFEFYAEHLGGKITMLTTHGAVPGPEGAPPGWKDAVLHARILLGGTEVFGADIPPDRFQPMRSAYLTLTLNGVAEAERIYALLADGGEIFMKMEETFFARRFAMLRDRFGTSWMLLYEKPLP